MQFSDQGKQAPAHDEKLRLHYGQERLQYGDLYLPQNRRDAQSVPLVILIHGGFWRAAYDLSLMEGLAKDLARRGIAAWNIEYRRVGDAGGGWPGTMRDVGQAADHVQWLAAEYNLDGQKVVAVGHSAGGHLALWLAGRPHLPQGSPITPLTTPLPLRGVVSLAGVADLDYAWEQRLDNNAAGELLGGSPNQLPERYAAASPAALLPLGVTQVLVHGTRDDRVPIEISHHYLGRAQAAGDQVKLIELPGEDHFVLIDASSQAWETTVREIERLLGR